LIFRPLSHRLLPPTLLAFGALVSAYAAASPDARLLKLLCVVIAFAVGLALTPQAFIAASMLLFAVSTANGSSPVSVLPSSPVPVYIGDVVVLLVAVRGALPRPRVPTRRALAGAPLVFLGLWVLVMAVAAVRGWNAGVGAPSALREDLALIYWPPLCFGFIRVLREAELDTSALWRDLALVAVGLAGWMLVAHVTNHPFHDTGLADVPTGTQTYVSRNFGFASAFIVYPALALVGIAGMAHGGTRRLRWLAVAAVGTVATLATLVRGEIFSLALGAVVVFWLRPRTIGESARLRTALQLGFAIVGAALAVAAASPRLGNAIVQRAIPFTHQSSEASANAHYRQKAVMTGIHVASAHPIGLGVLDPQRLYVRHIDQGYLAHSGVATLLLFGGWFALATAVLAILSVLRRSSRVSAPTPWLHAAFVAVIVMLAFYSVAAAGLAGDPWVIPLGALAIALRFARAGTEADASTEGVAARPDPSWRRIAAT
jgi:hypothetical protein